MKQIKRKFGLLGIVGAVMLLTGCLLISGTFVVVEEFDFTTHNGFYFYDVDITDEEDWEDNKDNIDAIDLVGFEMWFQNDESEAVTFSAYIDDPDQPEYTNAGQVDANAIKILDNLTLSVGATHLTYGNSFAYLQNVEAMKNLVKEGNFFFYGIADGGTATGYRIDSGKVIITFSASK